MPDKKTLPEVYPEASENEVKIKNSYFSMIPYVLYEPHILKDIGMSGVAFYGYLLRRGGQNNKAFPSYNTMQDELKISRKTISKLLKYFQKKNVLKIVKKEVFKKVYNSKHQKDMIMKVKKNIYYINNAGMNKYNYEYFLNKNNDDEEFPVFSPVFEEEMDTHGFLGNRGCDHREPRVRSMETRGGIVGNHKEIKEGDPISRSKKETGNFSELNKQEDFIREQLGIDIKTYKRMRMLQNKIITEFAKLNFSNNLKPTKFFLRYQTKVFKDNSKEWNNLKTMLELFLDLKEDLGKNEKGKKKTVISLIKEFCKWSGEDLDSTKYDSFNFGLCSSYVNNFCRQKMKGGLKDIKTIIQKEKEEKSLLGSLYKIPVPLTDEERRKIRVFEKNMEGAYKAYYQDYKNDKDTLIELAGKELVRKYEFMNREFQDENPGSNKLNSNYPYAIKNFLKLREGEKKAAPWYKKLQMKQREECKKEAKKKGVRKIVCGVDEFTVLRRIHDDFKLIKVSPEENLIYVDIEPYEIITGKKYPEEWKFKNKMIKYVKGGIHV